MLSHRWFFPHISCGVADGISTGFFFHSPVELPAYKFNLPKGRKFYIGSYHFTLYQNLQHADVCRYVVRRGSLHYYFSFLGIDSIIECDTKSNVDFIHFVWRNVEAQYAFRRRAITLFPDQYGFTLRLLCLRNYDVPSVGWTFSSGCSICSAAARDQVRPFTGCLAPAEACHRIICTRRPPP